MQCRHCKHRFLLSDTIFWSIPPGIPFSPLASLLGVVFVLSATVVLLCLIERRHFVVGGAGFLLAALFIGHYLIHWVFNRHPYTNQLAGTCPECGKYNLPVPWTAR